MKHDSKVYVAGHRGMVGSAICRALKKSGFSNVMGRTHSELPLDNQHLVERFFGMEKPEYVVLAAARVGGIHANNTYSAEFIYSNIQIQTNVIHAAYLFGVKRLIFVGSSCIYPKMCPQPMKEEYLLSGHLEPTNKPYAIAKICGIEMCRAYNRQYGTDFISVMPTNLYGLNDFYDVDDSHVLPAFMKKFHIAKDNKKKTVTCWGSGTPLRDFLCSDDLAEAVLMVMDHSGPGDLINIGSGKEITIRDLAKAIKQVVGFKGKIEWDSSMPDGTPRKVMDSSKMMAMGWKPTTELHDGLELEYKDFLTHESR